MIEFLLILVGYLLIYLEFFFPSWVFGSFALFSLIGASVLFPVWWAFLPIFAGGAIFAFIGLYQVRHKIALKESQEGFLASAFDPQMIGKRGVVATDLKPSGTVEIGQDRIPATSQTDYLAKGTSIEVVGGEGANLIVRSTKK